MTDAIYGEHGMREHIFKSGKRIPALLAAAVLVFACVFSGCGQKRSVTLSEEGPFVFYLNQDGDGLDKENYRNSEDMSVDAFLEALKSMPAKVTLKPLIDDELQIKGYTLNAGLLILDFSSAYKTLDVTREVLTRAGVVRTMVQAEGVSKVAFTVDGEEAVTPGNVTLGAMDANSFVEDAGRQINSIQNQKIRLYYADESGTKLNVEGRTIYYSSSKPLEWAIVERVIAGPKVSGNYPTLPNNTQIISVSSSNGICFVNLNRAFTDMALAVDPRIPVYSLVDALVDNCDSIDSVQISIDGESNISFRDSVNLSKPLTADHSLVQEE